MNRAAAPPTQALIAGLGPDGWLLFATRSIRLSPWCWSSIWRHAGSMARRSAYFWR